MPFSTKLPVAHVEHTAGVHVEQFVNRELQMLQAPVLRKYPLEHEEQAEASQI